MYSVKNIIFKQKTSGVLKLLQRCKIKMFIKFLVNVFRPHTSKVERPLNLED